MKCKMVLLAFLTHLIVLTSNIAEGNLIVNGKSSIENRSFKVKCPGSNCTFSEEGRVDNCYMSTCSCENSFCFCKADKSLSLESQAILEKKCPSRILQMMTYDYNQVSQMAGPGGYQPTNSYTLSNKGGPCKRAANCIDDLVCNKRSRCDFWGKQCVSDNECPGFCCEGGWCLSDTGSCTYLKSYRNIDTTVSTFICLLFVNTLAVFFIWFSGRARIKEIEGWIVEKEERNKQGDNVMSPNISVNPHHQEMVVNIKHDKSSPLSPVKRKSSKLDNFRIKLEDDSGPHLDLGTPHNVSVTNLDNSIPSKLDISDRSKF